MNDGYGRAPTFAPRTLVDERDSKRSHLRISYARLATALALRAAGEPVRAIAERLGVDLRTAYRYHAATASR